MARRYDDLYASLITFENLYLAYRKAAKGKRGQRAVADFEFDLDDNLFQRNHRSLHAPMIWCAGLSRLQSNSHANSAS